MRSCGMPRATSLAISAWIASLPISDEARQYNTHAGITAPPGGIMRWLQAGSSKANALAHHVLVETAKRETSFDALGEITLYAPVPRPGKIIGDFNIPFEYPRSPDLRFDAAFAQLSGEVSHALRGANS